MKTYILKTPTLMATLCTWAIRKFYRCTNVVIIDITKTSGAEVLVDVVAELTVPNVFMIGGRVMPIINELYKNKIPVTLIRQSIEVEAVIEQPWGLDVTSAQPMRWCWDHYGVGAAPHPYAMLMSSRMPAQPTFTGYGTSTLVCAYLANRTMSELDDILLATDFKWMSDLSHVSNTLKANNLVTLRNHWTTHEHAVLLGGVRVWCVNGGLLDGRNPATIAVEMAKEHGITGVYGDALNRRAYTLYSDGTPANRQLIKDIVSQYRVEGGSSGNVVQMPMQYIEG
jgi:hypothetical protein